VAKPEKAALQSQRIRFAKSDSIKPE